MTTGSKICKYPRLSWGANKTHPQSGRVRKVQRQLVDLGTPAGRWVIRRQLRLLKIARRTARKKKTMGHHPDRNAQFENIARLKREYLRRRTTRS